MNEKQSEVAETVFKEACRLHGLVTKILAFTVIGSKKPALLKESINLSTRIPQIVKPIFAFIKGKKIEFNFECPDEGAGIIMNDEFFDIVITCLVENVIKFNDKEIIKIGIYVKYLLGKVEISIFDNGRGIPAEDIKKIFAGFYQVEKYFTGQVQGVGLGLALVKRLVEAHDGTIEINSDFDKGTLAILVFPA